MFSKWNVSNIATMFWVCNSVLIYCDRLGHYCNSLTFKNYFNIHNFLHIVFCHTEYYSSINSTYSVVNVKCKIEQLVLVILVHAVARSFRRTPGVWTQYISLDPVQGRSPCSREEEFTTRKNNSRISRCASLTTWFAMLRKIFLVYHRRILVTYIEISTLL